MDDGQKTKKASREGVFVVDVKFRQNATWQGSVKCPPAGESVNFRSELELIKIMDSALDAGGFCDTPQDG